MRLLLLAFTLFYTAFLVAQTKADTVLSRWGDIAQVHYMTKVSSETLDKSERFQRGIREGDEKMLWKVDSIQLFQDGKVRRTIDGDRLSMPPLSAYRKDKTQTADVMKAKARKQSATPDYVEGRAGMRVRRKILAVEDDRNGQAFQRLDDSPEIKVLDEISKSEKAATIEVYIPAGSTSRKLKIAFGEEEAWEKNYSIHGYHLNESDFRSKATLTDEQTWSANGEEYLYLRLRSTEKLMTIYRGEEAFRPIPVGRQLDEIYVGGLEDGKYLLEIIDLRSREKRFHWVVK